MNRPTSSVLIPSFRRPSHLTAALESLAGQEVPPGEVIVVWQGDDAPTRDAAEACRDRLACPLRVLHLAEPGIVPAENLALAASTGEVVLLMDDDVVAPPDWVARHLAHYADPRVGAVGGPAVNFHPDGARFPERAVEPVGVVAWYGRIFGNLYDHIPAWRSRPPREVDHLVGYNLSLRRAAFGRFEDRLRRYWQMFELEACCQVKARGFKVLCDFANVVEHHPTNTAYIPGRSGDLTVKVDNAAFNQGFILGKYTPGPLRPVRMAYALGVGNRALPGLLYYPIAVRRNGNARLELKVLGRVRRNFLEGWRLGSRSRGEVPLPVPGDRDRTNPTPAATSAT